MTQLELGFFSGDIRFRLLNDAGDTDIREIIFDWTRRTEGIAFTGTITDAAFDAGSNVVTVTFPEVFVNTPFLELWIEADDGSQVIDVRIAGITDVVLLPGTTIPANTLVQKGLILTDIDESEFTLERLGVFRGCNTSAGATTFGEITADLYVTDGGFSAPLSNVPKHSVRWLAYYRE